MGEAFGGQPLRINLATEAGQAGERRTGRAQAPIHGRKESEIPKARVHS